MSDSRPDRDAAIYFGHVMHCRLRPFRHRFVYKVFSLFADIEKLDELASRTRLFSHNHFNLFSIYDHDHGAEDGSPIRPWIDARLLEVDLSLPGGRVFILCFPRIFGYVFNPLTVFFCFDKDGVVRAVVYEVRNTFAEKHAYAIAVSDVAPGALITHQQNKKFYVSPFIDMNMVYTFRLRVPGEKLSVMIREHSPEGEVLIATLTGSEQPFRTMTFLAAFFRYPLMSIKIIAAIHFEALRLFRKGAKFVARIPIASA